MSALTITVMRAALLVCLWLFIYLIARNLRRDIYHANTATMASVPVERPKRRQQSGLTHIAVLEGSMRGTVIPLTEAGVLIGRNPECTLVLSDDFASGRHARIYVDGGMWWIDDLRSTNGTFIGTQPVGDHVALQLGTQIRIGQTVLEMRA